MGYVKRMYVMEHETNDEKLNMDFDVTFITTVSMEDDGYEFEENETDD